MRGSIIAFALAAVLPCAAAAADAAKGKAVFEDQCSVCHDVAPSAEKKGGPVLKGLFQKAKLHDGKKLTEENVRARVNTGGNGMPPFDDMAKDDKDNLIAYLKTI